MYQFYATLMDLNNSLDQPHACGSLTISQRESLEKLLVEAIIRNHPSPTAEREVESFRAGIQLWNSPLSLARVCAAHRISFWNSNSYLNIEGP